jgi:DNA (cytosine-5)-methyltransferase 1
MPGGMIPFAANQRDEVRDLGVSSGALAANPGVKQQTFIAENYMTPWDTQQARVFTEDGASPALAGADGGGGRNPGGLIACEQRTARTLTARGDGSPNADGGPNIVALQVPAITMRLREGREGGGKGPLLQEERSGTLAVRGNQYLFKPAAIGVHQNQSGEVSVSDTAYALATNGNATGRNSPLVAHPDVADTLCASGAGLSRPAGMASEPDLCVVYALQGNMIGRQEQNGPSGSGVSENLAFTLTATDTPGVAAALPIPIHDKATRHNGGGKTRDNDGAGNGLGVGKPGDPAPTVTAGDHHAVASLDCRNLNESAELSGTLAAKGTGGYSLNFQNPVRNGYTVRRLTPTECERLQGFPDGWTAYGHDGKEISDTRRYQMLGNSVAIPCVRFVLGNIAEQIREEVLGDGIRPCA